MNFYVKEGDLILGIDGQPFKTAQSLDVLYGPYHVHYSGTLPDVRRRYRAGADSTGSHRQHEPEGRMRRFYFEPSSDEGIQSSGGSHQRRP